MRHALRLLFCCLLSLIIGMEAFAWLCGFGLNVSLTVVCGICLLVLLIYSVYDILDVVDDLKFYKDKYKQVRKENAELEEAIIVLKNRIEEYEFEVNMLQEEIRRLEGYDREETVNPTNRT